MSATPIQEENSSELTVNAVILYDEMGLAAESNAMLAAIASRADGAVRWMVKPWRLDLLILPAIADMALADAADAHLIVLALRQETSLPPWLLDWLRQWAERRHVNEAALAVWDKTNRERLSASSVGELLALARRHGLVFIFEEFATRVVESSVSSPRRRERDQKQHRPQAQILTAAAGKRRYQMEVR